MNDYYEPTGTPAFNARAVSATARNESALVEQAFDKLAAPDVLGSSAQNYGLDTGMPSALAVNINPNVTAPFDGMEIVVKVSYAATGPSTITAGQLAVAPVLRMDGSPTQPDDWLSGQIISMRYDATRGAYQYTPAYTGVAQVVVPLSDAAPIVKNAADPTKQIRIDASEIAPAATRTITMPDRNVRLGSEFNRISRTTNVAITKDNVGDFFAMSGASFVQLFDAVPTLGENFYCYIKNEGANEVEVVAPYTVTTTSATSNSISAGVTWTVATGLSIGAGNQFIARRTADPMGQRITGTVASYNSSTGALTATVQGRIGNGTFTDWTITIGTATIDGLPSYVMYSGEARLFMPDGANLVSAVIAPYCITRTASGIFVKPPGYRYHGGLLWAGGGSGRNGGAVHGGGGACHQFTIPDTSLTTVTPFTIAAGGAAVTAASTNGNVGGNSSFGNVVSYGGGPGVTAGVSNSGGGGGITSAGGAGIGGGPIGKSGSNDVYGGHFGGGVGSGNAFTTSSNSTYGGGGGDGGNSVYGGGGGNGGTSVFGGNGGTSVALDGVAPGGGGTGVASGPTSGAGARGELRAWGIA